jgi:hypothetical protein
MSERVARVAQAPAFSSIAGHRSDSFGAEPGRLFFGSVSFGETKEMTSAAGPRPGINKTRPQGAQSQALIAVWRKMNSPELSRTAVCLRRDDNMKVSAPARGRRVSACCTWFGGFPRPKRRMAGSNRFWRNTSQVLERPPLSGIPPIYRTKAARSRFSLAICTFSLVGSFGMPGLGPRTTVNPFLH